MIEEIRCPHCAGTMKVTIKATAEITSVEPVGEETVEYRTRRLLGEAEAYLDELEIQGHKVGTLNVEQTHERIRSLRQALNLDPWSGKPLTTKTEDKGPEIAGPGALRKGSQ